MRWLTAAWVTPSSRPAAVKLPVSAARANVSRCGKGSATSAPVTQVCAEPDREQPDQHAQGDVKITRGPRAVTEQAVGLDSERREGRVRPAEADAEQQAQLIDAGRLAELDPVGKDRGDPAQQQAAADVD